MNVISFKDLSLNFGSKQVFDSFTLSILKEERLLIKGESGSGKSSLLKLALGFIQPDEGQVFIEGQPLNRTNVWGLRQSMAYVSQDMNIGDGTVSGFIDDILRYDANRHLNIRPEEIVALFKKFALPETIYENKIEELSGGEKQRVAIIASILIDRPIYLLDEITSALDEKLKRIIAKYFMEMKGKTIVVVSHDPVWEEFDSRRIDLNEKTD